MYWRDRRASFPLLQHAQRLRVMNVEWRSTILMCILLRQSIERLGQAEVGSLLICSEKRRNATAIMDRREAIWSYAFPPFR